MRREDLVRTFDNIPDESRPRWKDGARAGLETALAVLPRRAAHELRALIEPIDLAILARTVPAYDRRGPW